MIWFAMVDLSKIAAAVLTAFGVDRTLLKTMFRVGCHALRLRSEEDATTMELLWVTEIGSLSWMPIAILVSSKDY